MLIGSASRRVAIIGGSRMPFARAHGAYAGSTNQDMLTAALRAVVERYALQGQRLGDVIAGAVHEAFAATSTWCASACCPRASTRRRPGLDIQRACGTSLEAAILVGNKIALGQIDAGIAAGVDTHQRSAGGVSGRLPRSCCWPAIAAAASAQRLEAVARAAPAHFKPVLPGVVEPRTGLSMGQSCELMAKTWQITREEQDQLAYAKPREGGQRPGSEGFYDDLVVPFAGLKRDNNVRADTTLEKLAKLRPVFDTSGSGTLTAGNSTPLTDGAAAVLLASEDWARARNLPVQAWLTLRQDLGGGFRLGERGPADGARLCRVRDAARRGPGAAGLRLLRDPRGLRRAGAVHAARRGNRPEYCRERLGLHAPLGSIDRASSTSRAAASPIGHPFAATGARIVGRPGEAAVERLPQAKRGLISVCTAGGMGVSAILERA